MFLIDLSFFLVIIVFHPYIINELDHILCNYQVAFSVVKILILLLVLIFLFLKFFLWFLVIRLSLFLFGNLLWIECALCGGQFKYW
jgi:hypothetical protein